MKRYGWLLALYFIKTAIAGEPELQCQDLHFAGFEQFLQGKLSTPAPVKGIAFAPAAALVALGIGQLMSETKLAKTLGNRISNYAWAKPIVNLTQWLHTKHTSLSDSIIERQRFLKTRRHVALAEIALGAVWALVGYKAIQRSQNNSFDAPTLIKFWHQYGTQKEGTGNIADHRELWHVTEKHPNFEVLETSVTVGAIPHCQLYWLVGALGYRNYKVKGKLTSAKHALSKDNSQIWKALKGEPLTTTTQSTLTKLGSKEFVGAYTQCRRETYGLFNDMQLWEIGLYEIPHLADTAQRPWFKCLLKHKDGRPTGQLINTREQLAWLLASYVNVWLAADNVKN